MSLFGQSLRRARGASGGHSLYRKEYINDAETSGDSESYFRAGMGIIESRDLVGRGVDGVAYLRAAAKEAIGWPRTTWP